MSSKELSKNTRRYPRVFLTKGIQEFDKILGIEAKWPDGSITGVLDISYIGAAIIKTSRVTTEANKGETIEFILSFSENDQNIPFKGEVVRVDEKLISVYFPELSIGARSALERFLKQKLVGLNTKLVDPKYYIKEQGFDFWFHGPHQTNIFIWQEGGEIAKATLEMNYQVLTLENDELFLSESKRFLDVPTEDYAYGVNNPPTRSALKNTRDCAVIVKEALSLLSQIEDTTGIVAKLSEKLLQL